MSLHIDYRPTSLDEVVGNEAAIESLKAVLSRSKPPSTFLFTGIGGTGKTTLARIVAKHLGCNKSDIKEMNSSSDRGISAIRQLEDDCKYAPLRGDKKFIILDEAHMLTKPSQEALLKVLEEPPEFVHIAVCTTNPEALKDTFKRRCHHYEMEPLSHNDIIGLLKRTLKAEKVPLKNFSRNVADKISELCNGSAGQAMKMLDMIIDIKDEEKALSILSTINVGDGSPEVIEICRVLTDVRINEKTRWLKIKDLLKNFKTDGESARRPILGYLEKVLLNAKDETSSAKIAQVMMNFSENYFNTGKSGLVLSCYFACHDED